MDSITQLQGKLNEANNLLQYVSRELDGYAERGNNSKINFSELKLRGEQYGFYEHPLKNCDFQDEYMTLLVSLLVSGDKEEEGWTILYQIATGADYKNDLPSLVKDAQTLTEERFAEILRMISSCNLSHTFAIDSLLLGHRMGADDAQLKLLAGIFELLKLDVAFLKEAMSFVQILDSTLWEDYAYKSKAWKLLTAQDMATYIGGIATNSIKDAMEMKDTRIVISDIVHNDKNMLLFDNWKAKEILFLRCKFMKIGGMFSSKKRLIFADCSFDENVAHFADDHRYKYLAHYVWTDEQYAVYRNFIKLSNSCFVRCAFTNFRDAVPMMDLDKCLIRECMLEKCGQGPSSSILLKFRNSNITTTTFKECSSYRSYGTNGSSRNGNDTSTGCVIYLSNSKSEENIFDNCSNMVCDGSYGFSCLVILDNHSYMKNCQFSNSGSSWSGDRYRHGRTYMLQMCNSEESENKGVDSIGHIDSVPEKIFLIVDKL